MSNPKGTLASKEVSFYCLTFIVTPFVAIASYVADFYIVLALLSLFCLLRVSAHTSIHGNNFRVIHLGTSLRIRAVVFTTILGQLFFSSINRDIDGIVYEIGVTSLKCKAEETLTEKRIALANNILFLMVLPVRLTEQGIALAMAPALQRVKFLQGRHLDSFLKNLAKDNTYKNRAELKIHKVLSDYQESKCVGRSIKETAYIKIVRGFAFFLRRAFELWRVLILLTVIASSYLAILFYIKEKKKK